MTTPHLDEEALSAALDGAASDAEQAHLSSCRDCQATMAALAAVARAVAAPVTPPPRREIDAAIERAVAASALPPLTVTPPAVGSPGGRHGRARWLVTAGAVAAAVVLVGAIVAGTRSVSVHRTSSANAPGVASPTTTSGPIAGADLGDQSNSAALSDLVLAALGPHGPSEGTPPPAVNPPAAASSAATGPAATAAASIGGVSGGGLSTASSAVAPNALPTCTAQARGYLGSAAAGAALRFSAPLRWRGQPAVAVVFSGPNGLAGAVMSSATCSLLVVLAL